MNRFIQRAADKAFRTYVQSAYLFGKKHPYGHTGYNAASGSCPDKGTPAEVSVCPVYGNKNGIVTIVSDDGDFNTGKKINELSGKYCVPFTVAGTVLNIARHELWWKRVLKSNARMELVNHSYNHIRMEEGSEIAADKTGLTHELVHSQRYFESRFGVKQICFICPENLMCTAGYELLKDSGVIAVRRGARGYNDLSLHPGKAPGELFNLRIRGIMDDGGSKRKQWLEDAAVEKKWLIEMWHNISDRDDGGFQTILTEDAGKHLGEIRECSDAGLLWAARMTDAVKYIIERMYFEPAAVICDDELCISLSEKENGFDTAVFDHPLTVLIRIPGREITGANRIMCADGSVGYLADIRPGETRRFTLA